MARKLKTALLGLLLLTVAVVANASSKSESEPVRRISEVTTTRTNRTLVNGEGASGGSSRGLEPEESDGDEDDTDEEEDDDDEDDTRAGDDEYEGEDEADEYEDELRAAAESHEAMSRHEKKIPNSIRSSIVAKPISSEVLEQKQLSAMKKGYDSRERSIESGSDESEASNEAIDKTMRKEQDEEVEELLKYKKLNRHRLSGGRYEEKLKEKRVPTVKKELSTQKEIKMTNESHVEKRFGTKQMLDELNEKLRWSVLAAQSTTESTPEYSKSTEGIRPIEEGAQKVYFERPSLDSKITVDTKFSDLEVPEPPRFEKRQEAVLRDLEAFLRAEYAVEQEQQQKQKLQELGAQEGALAENLLELLIKLAENPRRWERVHRLLMDVEGGLELSRQALEARKRSFNLPDTVTTTTASPVSSTPKKGRKKPKKKKKKPRHHRFSTTTTTIPSAPPLLTTTESPWLMQWRLFAERLYGPSWPQDLQDDPNVAKVRFAVSSKPRTPSPGSELSQKLTDSKQRVDHKALNSERQALMLESAREYTQPRHLHYGKVNTHQSSHSHRDPPADNFASNRDTTLVRDYDPPEPDFSRYGQYAQPREYSRGRDREDDFLPPQSYAQNHEYRPPGREYAASKNWQDAQFKYGHRSWKTDERPSTSSKWAWRQTTGDPKMWPQVEDTKQWNSDRDYWPHVQEEDKTWPPQRSHPEPMPPWGRIGGSDTWPIKSPNITPWSGDEKVKSYSREETSPLWQKSKSRPSQQAGLDRDPLKQQAKEKMLPKITMKTWNSLTSDPATWPFKLPGAKPWPKDENGKSYNPNADLVRKLGLDDQGRSITEKNEQSDFKPAYQPDGISKYKNGKLKSKDTAMKSQQLDLQKTPISWPVKVSNDKQWPKTSKDFNADAELAKALSLENDRSESRPWNTNMDKNPKTWPPKTAMSPKIQSVGAWVMPADHSTWKPYNLKPVESYNRDLENADRHRWSAEMNTDPRTWPPKPESHSWPPKLTDSWNKFSKPPSSGTWPKWKQFAYHRVTAMPGMTPGSAVDGARARNNAFIAVSAVSPRYNNNQWRKNDIEETPVDASSGGLDPDHPASQLHAGAEPAIYTWKKDSPPMAFQGKRNSTDPLEHQLEELRRSASWSHTENILNIKKQLNAINDASESLASHIAASGSTGSSGSNSSNGPHSPKNATTRTKRVGPQPDPNQNKEVVSK